MRWPYSQSAGAFSVYFYIIQGLCPTKYFHTYLTHFTTHYICWNSPDSDTGVSWPYCIFSDGQCFCWSMQWNGRIIASGQAARCRMALECERSEFPLSASFQVPLFWNGMQPATNHAAQKAFPISENIGIIKLELWYTRISSYTSMVFPLLGSKPFASCHFHKEYFFSTKQNLMWTIFSILIWQYTLQLIFFILVTVINHNLKKKNFPPVPQYFGNFSNTQFSKSSAFLLGRM